MTRARSVLTRVTLPFLHARGTNFLYSFNTLLQHRNECSVHKLTFCKSTTPTGQNVICVSLHFALMLMKQISRKLESQKMNIHFTPVLIHFSHVINVDFNEYFGRNTFTNSAKDKLCFVQKVDIMRRVAKFQTGVQHKHCVGHHIIDSVPEKR